MHFFLWLTHLVRPAQKTVYVPLLAGFNHSPMGERIGGLGLGVELEHHINRRANDHVLMWICHQCLSFDLDWVEVEGHGRIYSWERAWHPVHAALKQRQEPYITALVELPEVNNIRMIGNLLGDPHQDVIIGTPVDVVFEHHPEADPAYTLAHWRVVAGS